VCGDFSAPPPLIVSWEEVAVEDRPEMVVAKRDIAPGGLVHHSGRGVRYACGDDIEWLEQAGIQPSMSRAGCAWDIHLQPHLIRVNALHATVTDIAASAEVHNMTRMWMLIWICAAAAALGLAIVPFYASAAPTPGLALSQKYCVRCHMIAPTAKQGWTDAPAFDALANRPGTTIASLTAIIEKPHMNMLNTARPANEAHEIAAYIMTLRQHP
jgi:mono/diheme cytochrome c family protein